MAKRRNSRTEGEAVAPAALSPAGRAATPVSPEREAWLEVIRALARQAARADHAAETGRRSC